VLLAIRCGKELPAWFEYAGKLADRLEEQLKAAWKHICGLRNVEHAEKRGVSETKAQKHSIDEKCADVRRDSHMQ
jgi:hypothetical protein